MNEVLQEAINDIRSRQREIKARSGTCCHIRANGTRCLAFRIRESDFCYFHSRDRQRRRVLHDNLDTRRVAYAKGDKYANIPENFDDYSTNVMNALDLPPVEDYASLL